MPKVRSLLLMATLMTGASICWSDGASAASAAATCGSLPSGTMEFQLKVNIIGTALQFYLRPPGTVGCIRTMLDIRQCQVQNGHGGVHMFQHAGVDLSSPYTHHTLSPCKFFVHPQDSFAILTNPSALCHNHTNCFLTCASGFGVGRKEVGSVVHVPVANATTCTPETTSVHELFTQVSCEHNCEEVHGHSSSCSVGNGSAVNPGGWLRATCTVPSAARKLLPSEIPFSFSITRGTGLTHQYNFLIEVTQLFWCSKFTQTLTSCSVNGINNIDQDFPNKTVNFMHSGIQANDSAPVNDNACRFYLNRQDAQAIVSNNICGDRTNCRLTCSTNASLDYYDKNGTKPFYQVITGFHPVSVTNNLFVATAAPRPTISPTTPSEDDPPETTTASNTTTAASSVSPTTGTAAENVTAATAAASPPVRTSAAQTVKVSSTVTAQVATVASNTTAAPSTASATIGTAAQTMTAASSAVTPPVGTAASTTAKASSAVTPQVATAASSVMNVSSAVPTAMGTAAQNMTTPSSAVSATLNTAALNMATVPSSVFTTMAAAAQNRTTVSSAVFPTVGTAASKTVNASSAVSPTMATAASNVTVSSSPASLPLGTAASRTMTVSSPAVTAASNTMFSSVKPTADIRSSVESVVASSPASQTVHAAASTVMNLSSPIATDYAASTGPTVSLLWLIGLFVGLLALIALAVILVARSRVYVPGRKHILRTLAGPAAKSVHQTMHTGVPGIDSFMCTANKKSRGSGISTDDLIFHQYPSIHGAVDDDDEWTIKDGDVPGSWAEVTKPSDGETRMYGMVEVKTDAASIHVAAGDVTDSSKSDRRHRRSNTARVPKNGKRPKHSSWSFSSKVRPNKQVADTLPESHLSTGANIAMPISVSCLPHSPPTDDIYAVMPGASANTSAEAELDYEGMSGFTNYSGRSADSVYASAMVGSKRPSMGSLWMPERGLVDLCQNAMNKSPSTRDGSQLVEADMFDGQHADDMYDCIVMPEDVQKLVPAVSANRPNSFRASARNISAKTPSTRDGSQLVQAAVFDGQDDEMYGRIVMPEAAQKLAPAVSASRPNSFRASARNISANKPSTDGSQLVQAAVFDGQDDDEIYGRIVMPEAAQKLAPAVSASRPNSFRALARNISANKPSTDGSQLVQAAVFDGQDDDEMYGRIVMPEAAQKLAPAVSASRSSGFRASARNISANKSSTDGSQLVQATVFDGQDNDEMYGRVVLPEDAGQLAPATSVRRPASMRASARVFSTNRPSSGNAAQLVQAQAFDGQEDSDVYGRVVMPEDAQPAPVSPAINRALSTRASARVVTARGKGAKDGKDSGHLVAAQSFETQNDNDVYGRIVLPADTPPHSSVPAMSRSSSVRASATLLSSARPSQGKSGAQIVTAEAFEGQEEDDTYGRVVMADNPQDASHHMVKRGSEMRASGRVVKPNRILD